MNGDTSHMLQPDQFKGESDSQFKRRKDMEGRMAEYEPKAKPADPFAGFPQDEDPW